MKLGCLVISYVFEASIYGCLISKNISILLVKPPHTITAVLCIYSGKSRKLRDSTENNFQI